MDFPQWLIQLPEVDAATRKELNRCAKYWRMQDADEPYARVASLDRTPYLYAKLDYRYYPISCPIPDASRGFYLEGHFTSDAR
jgi:hypothetical protein